MQSADIDSRLKTLELMIDYVLNLLYGIQKSCLKMDKHVDFVETIGGVLRQGRNEVSRREVTDHYDPGV